MPPLRKPPAGPAAGHSEVVPAGTTARRSDATPPEEWADRPHDAGRVASDVQHQLDLVEQRLAELTEQTQRLQRLAGMGTMSAMLAHEFRNLMTPVVGYVQYALRRREPEIVERALTTTLKNAETAAALCERIVRMATDAPSNPRRVPECAAPADAIGCLGLGQDRD
ncbi:MAG: hypothetical protein V3T70_03320, partial [Phycisphaerae bacterium]